MQFRIVKTLTSLGNTKQTITQNKQPVLENAKQDKRHYSTSKHLQPTFGDKHFAVFFFIALPPGRQYNDFDKIILFSPI